MCIEVFENLGYNFIKHDENLLEWETSFSFFDGDKITFFTEQIANKIRFFDAGLTVLHIETSGLMLDNLKPIKNALRKFSTDIEQNGEISLVGTPTDGYNDFIRALLHIADWEAETVNHPYANQLLKLETEAYLKRRSHALVQKDAKVKGSSGSQHNVDFIQGDEYVFVMKSNSNSSSRIIRKLLDIKNSSSYHDKKSLVIFDDSEKTSDIEATIVSSIANKVLPLSSMLKIARQDHSLTH